MDVANFKIAGLSDVEVTAARLKYGSNSLSFKKGNGIIDTIKGLAKEPMVKPVYTN